MKPLKTRREFLSKSSKLLLITSFLPFTSRCTFNGKQPNILLLFSDEHNAGVLGCYGNSIINTPNLDVLAQKGVVFENCYTNSPICVPSRLSFISGQYASRGHVWSNSCWLPSDDLPSIARVMTKAGYDSYLCGKMHFDKTRTYGFTEIQKGLDRWNGKEWEKTGKGGRRKPDDLAPRPGLSDRLEEIGPGESHITQTDAEVTALTVDFLQNRNTNDKPFFYIAGFVAPHFPLIVPEKYWNNYKGKVGLPKIPKGHLDKLPLNYKHVRTGFNVESVPDETTIKARELYYGLTEWLDNEIGKVLTALNDSKLADNTIVIYTTDHGEDMGEHGQWWKNVMYDCAAKIPLIISFPPKWKGGQRRAHVCSLLDLTQTIAELGSAQAPQEWDGHSLVSVLEDKNTNWPNIAVGEYYAHNITSGFTMLRKDQWKYVYHTKPTGDLPPERELYNMIDDPEEFNNLAQNEEYKELIAKLHADLVSELRNDPEKIEQICRKDYKNPYKKDI